MRDMKAIYPIGSTVGDFDVLGHTNNHDAYGKLYLICKCRICNKMKKIVASDISNRPGTVSHQYCVRKTYSKHNGLLEMYPKIYRSFSAIQYRCNYPTSKDYHNYGGRGIKCMYSHDNEGFKQFIIDMDPLLQAKIDELLSKGEYATREEAEFALSVDRIDVNGHYEPGNMRWATPSEQTSNRRCTKQFIAHDLTTGMYYISNNAEKFAANHGIKGRYNINRRLSGVVQNPVCNGFSFEYAYPPDQLFYYDWSNPNLPNVIREFY